MAWLDTPWGRVRVPDDIPVAIACARCGTCCRAFFLSVTDETLAEWRARRDRGDVAGLPPDLDAVLELFVPLAEPPRTPDGSWYTCRAFDPARNLCTLLPDHPEKRPQACYAFPYIYDRQSFAAFPYPQCRIFRAVAGVGAIS